MTERNANAVAALPRDEPGSDVERCRVFAEGDDLYEAMLRDLSRAHKAIRLESYIFAGDEMGWQFAKVLAERARAGVSVRVHVDAAGAMFEGTGKLFGFLRSNGVEARWFNGWRWSNPLRFNRRNHRKLMVVDRECVYVGGFNIHRESSQALVGARRWRDVHVRVSGRLNDHAATLFDELWARRTYRTLPPWDGAYRLVPNATRACRQVLHCLYLDAIAAAEHSICLTTPYFVPDRRLREALVSASKRGVLIRVIVPATGDNRLVRWAGHALARPMASAGVQFYEYLPRMLHAKVLVIDDAWASLGSANTDYRSFFINCELNLISDSTGLCRQLGSLFREDLLHARELDLFARRRDRIRSWAEALSRRLKRWL